MIRHARSPEKGGTLSCRFLSCSMYSLGTMSILVEKSCPTLMKVGPSLSRFCVTSAPSLERSSEKRSLVQAPLLSLRLILRSLR